MSPIVEENTAETTVRQPVSSNDESAQTAAGNQVYNSMQEVLELQKDEQRSSGPADYATRMDRMGRLEKLLRENQSATQKSAHLPNFMQQ